jgi:calcineurin-like phosphoesterase family protein
LQRIAQTGAEHHLILGNHDQNIRKNSDLQELCASVSTMKTIFIEKQMVIMCHFPLAHFESEETSYMLHGHCHGGYKADGNILDVGIDNRVEADMMPWTWDEVKRHMKTVKPKIGHHGAP